MVPEEEIGYSEQCDEDDNVGIYQLSIPVHEKDNDQRRHHKADKYVVHSVSGYSDVFIIGAEEDPEVDDTVEKLDNSVAGRYLRTAGMTFTLEHTPADDGYEVTLSDGGAAGHAVRILLSKALIKGKAVYADIQEAANAHAENEHEEIQYQVHQTKVIHIRILLSCKILRNDLSYLHFNILQLKLQ